MLILKLLIKPMISQVDKNFQGRTKIFNAIAENFCPRIKIFGRTIFFLTGHGTSNEMRPKLGEGKAVLAIYIVTKGVISAVHY